MTKGLQASFRVYLPRSDISSRRPRGKSRGFWDVFIFDSPQHLRAFLASDDLPGGAYKTCCRTLGFCRAIRVLMHRGGFAPSPGGRRGLVALSFPACGAGAVSHEWTHAAHYEMTSHRDRKAVSLDDHEKLAWLQGEFVRRFWNGFYRRFRLHGRQWVPV